MKYLSYEGLQYLYSKILTRLGLKVDATGGDISETVIETLDTIDDKYPVPAAGESVKRFSGKVLTFLRNIKPLTSYIELYVATTGSDTTGNGTSGSPFKTIQHAIDILPKDLGGNFATITVASGTYAEDIKIIDFHGGGLFLYSDTKDTIADTCKLQSMDIKYNSAYVMVNGFTLTTTTKDAMTIWGCLNVRVWYCQSTVVANYMGIYFGESGGRILYCKFANKSIVLQAVNSTVYSGNWNAGSTGNTIGLQSFSGSILLLAGAQPTATTLRTQSDSGQYFYDNGTQIIGPITSGLSCTWGTFSGGYIRHGNLKGIAMVTISLSVNPSIVLSASNLYRIYGFPVPSVGAISVLYSSQGVPANCYMEVDGTIVFQPLSNVPLPSGFLFSATYLTSS